MPTETETTTISNPSLSPGKQPLSQKQLRALFQSSDYESWRGNNPHAVDLSLLYASVESLGSVGSLGVFKSKDISNIFASSESTKMPPLTGSGNANPFASVDAALLFASIDPLPLMSLDGKVDSKEKTKDVGMYESRDWLRFYEGTHQDISYGKDLFKTKEIKSTRTNSKWNDAYLSALQAPPVQVTSKKPKPVTEKIKEKKPVVTSKPTGRGEPKEKIYVEPLPTDIISGRGGKSNAWPGNMRYREVIEEAKPSYNEGAKFEKTIKSQEVVDLLLNEGRRFLKLEETPGPHKGEYYLMTKNQARKKAGQALREENTPESRKRKREFYAKKNK